MPVASADRGRQVVIRREGEVSMSKFNNRSRSALALAALFTGLSLAVPTANGLDFPTATELVLPEVEVAPVISIANLTVTGDVAVPEAAVAPVQVSEMARVAALAHQVELARTVPGAKYVTRTIMKEDYKWGDAQFTCINRLWSKESHWNYKAHNYRSGAHGIAQALPASKMEVIATDWRTNPVTQIRWGLRYISMRYSTPCKAWAKFKRSHYY